MAQECLAMNADKLIELAMITLKRHEDGEKLTLLHHPLV